MTFMSLVCLVSRDNSAAQLSHKSAGEISHNSAAQLSHNSTMQTGRHARCFLPKIGGSTDDVRIGTSPNSKHPVFNASTKINQPKNEESLHSQCPYRTLNTQEIQELAKHRPLLTTSYADLIPCVTFKESAKRQHRRYRNPKQRLPPILTPGKLQ